MKELLDYRFRMLLRGGGDIWGLSGFNNGKFVWVSTPVSLDRDNEVVTTYSGSQYKLINPDGNKEKIFAEIERIIERKGYEIF